MFKPQGWRGKGTSKGDQSGKGGGKGKKGDKGKSRTRDPEDRGHLRPELEWASRRLAMLLRHDGLSQLELGSFKRGDEWCRVDWLLSYSEFQKADITFRDIEEIVRESFSKDKPRFEIGWAGKAPPQGRPNLELVFVRATHKHTNVKSQNISQHLKQKMELEKQPAPEQPGRDTNQRMPSIGEEEEEVEGEQELTGDPWFDSGDPWGGIGDKRKASTRAGTPIKNKVSSNADSQPVTTQGQELVRSTIAIFLNYSLVTGELEAYLDACKAATGSINSGTAGWQRYVTEEGAEWYWHPSTEEAFFAHSPGEWALYEEPNTQRKYWYKDDVNWFFVDTCTSDTSNNDDPRDEVVDELGCSEGRLAHEFESRAVKSSDPTERN